MLHVEGFSTAARAMINSGPRLVQELDAWPRHLWPSFM